MAAVQRALKAAKEAEARSYNERRSLSKVYETLDAGLPQQALKLVVTYLKKHPESQMARAIKALVHNDLAQKEEAYAICQEVLAESPNDDAVIHPLRLTLVRLGRGYEMRRLYEQLATAEPQNRRLARLVFFACAKEGDFKSQQAAAMKLYKLKEKEKYFYWSITSNFLLAGGRPFVQDGEVQRLGKTVADGTAVQPATDARMLALSEMLLKKRFGAKAPAQLGVFLLYLSILTSQGKYKEAEESLRADSSFASLFKEEHVRLKYHGRVCGQLGMWDNVLQIYKGLLVSQQPDDWGYAKNYLNALFNLRTTESADQSAARLEEALAFFRQLQSDNPRLRGPFLSEVELEHRLLEDKVKTDDAHLKALLVAYFKRFGSKPVCYYDIGRYIVALEGGREEAQQEAFIDLLRATVESLPADASPEAKERWYTAQATIEKFRRRLGLHSRLSLEGIETEIGPGEDLALLAGHLMLDAYRQGGDVGYVVAGAAILEACLRGSKYNFQAKVLLIQFYRLLDAATAAHDLYTSLEVKYIQHDTVSHLIMDILITHGLTSEALKVCSNIRHFHEVKTREPYKSENYHKVTEMMEFGDQLRRSQQLAVTRTEELHLLLGTQADTRALLPVTASRFVVGVPPHAEALVTDEQAAAELSHNQDPVIVEWDPPSTAHPASDGLASSADMGSGRSSVDEQKRWLRVRSLVAKALHRLVALAHASAPAPEAAPAQPAPQKGKGKAPEPPKPAVVAAPVDKPALLASARDALRQLGELLPVVLSLEGTAAFSLEAEDAAVDLNGAKTDVRAWQLVWRVFRTFAVVAQLVVSVAENKVEEQTMHEAIKRLQALPAQFEGVAQHVLGELEPAGTQAGGFNGAALREACFVVVQLSAWTAALFQAWSAAFPAKQRRKNHPANSVQEAKAPLTEGAAAIARSLESVGALLKKRLGDAATLKPALPSSTLADLSTAFHQKEVTECTAEVQKKVTQSWQESLKSLTALAQQRVTTLQQAAKC
ncbi:uncharacterized protein ACA1_059820 [Acanthamoeba castellanii str. Neff]|uniref:Uncharacterized protein n=1 Tax=Acanthamoeba castellanii (strain ATCC 30010 / Neff) TaxID=1257118 RepID=L8GW85_ACACF|nr:uncharacterized protein ACA1_059820 [Acanthamoeba castellanii str. Neff]ELR17265.1 hypothetical protein ACA1_059820 [Acanthamoeba castellanii str. Neff]